MRDRQMIVAWLKSGRATLFGRPFDLSQNPEEAAAWFQAQMEDFIEFATQEMARRQRGAEGVVYAKPMTTVNYPRRSFDVV